MPYVTLANLLREEAWGEFDYLIDGLKTWPHYHLLTSALEDLESVPLYQSHIHGRGHIERTLLLAALLARREALPQEQARLLLLAAVYHDIGRISDSYDTEHGLRAARRLDVLTGLAGEELGTLQVMVAAHSRPDSEMEETLAIFPHTPAALELARLLKDADGLDRVRICDLNPAYLRHQSARDLAPFARFLHSLYGPPKAKPWL